MEKAERDYYDCMKPACGGCAWLKDGEYPDGRKYQACSYYGYILKRKSDADCPMAMNKARKEIYLTSLLPAGKSKKKR